MTILSEIRNFGHAWGLKRLFKKASDGEMAIRTSSNDGDGSAIAPSNYSAPLTAAAASATETLATGATKAIIRSTHGTTTNYFLVAIADSAAAAKAIVDAGEGYPVYGLEKIVLNNPYADAPAYLAYIRVSAADQAFHVIQGK